MFNEDIDTTNNILNKFGILVLSKNKQIGQKRNIPKEIIDSILINGLQPYEKYETLNLVEISIKSNTIAADLNGYKNYTGWPTKMPLFFFGNNFYKNEETFKIFSPQLLEVYRILLVETTLESIMFYYTFSVINTMFVPCTVLLYGSTAATRTLK